jgi:hypothetical protein
MIDNREISLAEVKKIYRYSSLGEVEHKNSTFVEFGLHIVTSFQSG